MWTISEAFSNADSPIAEYCTPAALPKKDNTEHKWDSYLVESDCLLSSIGSIWLDQTGELKVDLMGTIIPAYLGL